jgi:hypothetical protein
MWGSVALAALASVGLQVLGVVVLAALRPKSNIYFTIAGVSVLTAPAAWLGGPQFFDSGLGADGQIFLVVMHLALAGLFFHFMTLPDRSVTLRMLVELLLAPGRQLTVAQLNARYSLRDMIESRIKQLSDGRFLEVRADRSIRLLKRGEWFGRFVTAGRRLFRIESAN